MTGVIVSAFSFGCLVGFWAFLHRHIRGVWRERARKQVAFDHVRAFLAKYPGWTWTVESHPRSSQGIFMPPPGYVSPHEQGRAFDC